MNPTLILQAQQRKAQIKNNGTVEQLREVLRAVWPEDTQLSGGSMPFYSCWDFNPKRWAGTRNAIDLPVINVTDFYEEEKPSFTWGQEVMWKDIPVKFLSLIPDSPEECAILSADVIYRTYLSNLSPIPSKITPEQAAGEMWELLKQIAEGNETNFEYAKQSIKLLLNRIK